MRKKSLALLFALIMCPLIFSSVAFAIDFKIKGVFSVGFGVGNTNLINKRNGNMANRRDDFAARQRALIAMRAIATEDLEAFLAIKFGPVFWGNAESGGAIGTDGNSIRLAQANILWTVPTLDMKIRMGMQYVALPAAAGGTTVFEDRVAGITANYEFNNNVGLTAVWMRPFNDNYAGGNYLPDKPIGIHSTDPAGYLDNMDLFMVSLPLNFNDINITPWVMYGIQGRNVPYFIEYYNNWFGDGAPAVTTTPYLARLEDREGLNISNINRTSRSYGSMFWLGVPIKIANLDNWNLEFDFNYGYVESIARFDVAKRNNWHDIVRGDTQRQGWVAKALAEYVFDWGKPGVFGWYGSGDDGNVKNGSERLPSLCAFGNFTSFMGYGEGMQWEVDWLYRAKSLSYAGTWGVGLFVKDIEIFENAKMLLRAALWGGTNSPAMVKYMTSSSSWESPTNRYDSLYLTTNDNLLEFNAVLSWDIYENLNCLVDLGYIANFMDNDTWKKDYPNFGSYEKRDAVKAQVIFQYEF